MPIKDRWRAFVTPWEVFIGDYEPMKRRMQEAGLLPAKVKKRAIESEKNKVQTGNSEAYSSNKSLYYHDIPPEFFRRVAKRHTVGHTKYNDDPVPITMNLNWRTGLDDPLYVMDRLNHMFEHFVDFLDNGNDKDDNLGAIGWCVCFLVEAERLHPEILHQVIKQSRFSGKEAQERKEILQEMQKVKK